MTAELEVEASPVTLWHVHPAGVILPDGRILTKAMARVTRQRVYVWAEQEGTPTLVFSGALADPWAPLAQLGAAYVPTDAGVVLVKRERGCGCAAPPSRFVPWTPDRRAAR